MSYNFITKYNSPNHGAKTVLLPCKDVVLHWWGTPANQDPQGIINWLCNPASKVSSHSVIWPGNVACIVDYCNRSWANGNNWANDNSITLECDPSHVNETIPTIAEYLADLVRQGILRADFRLSGHKDWYSTACPGDYYDRLKEIRDLVRRNLTLVEPKKEGKVTEAQANRIIELLEEISRRALVVSDSLTPGQEGVKFDGHTFTQLKELIAK